MIYLAIADDHPVVREGLKRLISSYNDMQIVCEASQSSEIIPLLEQNDIDILLLDISMPGGSFLETLKRIRNQFPNIKILVLSVHPEENYALRAYKAGASGYLTKEHSPEELADAIRQINRGEKYISSCLAEQLLNNGNKQNIEHPHDILSNREYEILCMIGSGKRLTDIADELSLSPKTISAHRSHILKKLNLNSTSELIRYALERGIAQ